MPIPKIIHQIWIQGYDELPQDLKAKHKLIKQNNQDYQVILWDDVKIKKLLKKYDAINYLYYSIEIMDGFIKKYQSQSDVARLIILKEYGGFYIDIDYYCPLSLDILYGKNDEIVTANSEYRILKYIPFIYRPKYGATFVGVTKNHKLFEGLLIKLEKQTNKNKIGVLFDKYLQTHHYKVKLIDTAYVSSHASCCTGICYAPQESTSIMGRALLTYVGCHLYIIIVIIFIIIFTIIIYIKHRKIINQCQIHRY